MAIGTGAKVAIGTMLGFGAGMAVGAVEVDKKRRELGACKNATQHYARQTDKLIRGKAARLRAKGLEVGKITFSGGDVHLSYPPAKRLEIRGLLDEHARDSLPTVKKALRKAGAHFFPWTDGTPGWDPVWKT